MRDVFARSNRPTVSDVIEMQLRGSGASRDVDCHHPFKLLRAFNVVRDSRGEDKPIFARSVRPVAPLGGSMLK